MCGYLMDIFVDIYKVTVFVYPMLNFVSWFIYEEQSLDFQLFPNIYLCILVKINKTKKGQLGLEKTYFYFHLFLSVQRD